MRSGNKEPRTQEEEINVRWGPGCLAEEKTKIAGGNAARIYGYRYCWTKR